MALDNLTNVPIRPLNKGMFRNLPSNALPVGAFLRAQNYRINEYGLRRRDGLINFDENNNDVMKTSILDVIHFYRRALESQTLYLSEKMIARKNGLSLTSYNITDTSATITSNESGTEPTVTFISTGDIYEYIRVGDYIDLSGTNYEIKQVAYTESSGTYTYVITVYSYDTPFVTDEHTGSTTITYNFISNLNMTPSYALLPVEGTGNEDALIFADQADRGLYIYRADDTLSLYPIDSSGGGAVSPNYNNLISGRTVTYFSDRLWIGNTVEIDGEHRQRIRWSDVATYDRFQFENYLDLPYTEGALLALKPLGSLLIAYFEDAIYFGRAANIANSPYIFTKMETGLVGPICDRAICTWVDTHYFVGTDDIYSLSEATGLTPIGTPILTESLDFSKELSPDLKYHIKAVHDLETESIAFLIPDYYDPTLELAGPSERIWRFFYKTGSWAYDEVHFADTEKRNPDFLYLGLCSSKVYLYGRSWEDWVALDPTGDSTTVDSDLARWVRDDGTMAEGDTFDDYPSWYSLVDESIKPRTMKMSVYKTAESRIMLVEEDKDAIVDTLLTDTYPIWTVLESPDYDLGLPDVTKTFTRLSVKSFRNRVDRYSGDPYLVDQIDFDLYLSVDMGHSFKRPLSLRWRDNYNEGKADFRASGSTLRFKLISSAEIQSYKLSEAVLRVTARGLQIQV